MDNKSGPRKLKKTTEMVRPCEENERGAHSEKNAGCGDIGVRDGGSQGAVDPPIRADIRHLFGKQTTHLFN